MCCPVTAQPLGSDAPGRPGITPVQPRRPSATSKAGPFGCLLGPAPSAALSPGSHSQAPLCSQGLLPSLSAWLPATEPQNSPRLESDWEAHHLICLSHWVSPSCWPTPQVLGERSEVSGRPSIRMCRVSIGSYGTFHHTDSAAVAWAQYLWLRLSFPKACGILVPQPGIKPVFPALAGGFLTTGPPGKSLMLCVKGEAGCVPSTWILREAGTPGETRGWS